MNKEEIKHLAEKFLKGTATAEEKRRLHSWSALNNEHDDEVVLTSKPEDANEVKARVYDRIQHQIHLDVVPVGPKKIKLWYKVAAVAAALILISGLTFYLSRMDDSRGSDLADAKHISIGKNAAILTLADGRKIDLLKAENGRLTEESGVAIRKTTDGKLVYEVKDVSTPVNNEAHLNTISTPKGGQYQVILPDETIVWLNAASSIKFPAGFTNLKQRKVQLSGEAYFEVAKDKEHPFIVQTDQQEIEVLGTHFNLNAYGDEQSIKTTLLEGRVRVLSGKDLVVLKPGQQSLLRNHKLDVANADTEEAVAWKNGYFKFNSEPLPSIMRKLSRWYDVEVVYEGKPGDDRFGGTISRYKNVADVLEMLESTKLVKFKVEGRKIIVR
uniref:FecR family protein n=1 Tax=Pedobacter schmidteae TaxID=2201271 RepID=UPI000EAC14C1|nr:FecR family protein [Pedobacter schmidteae]